MINAFENTSIPSLRREELKPCSPSVVEHKTNLPAILRTETDSLLHEEEWPLSQERFKRLVVNSSDIICVIDAKANYIYISESVEHNLGYQPSYFEGQNAFEFIHPDDRQLVASSLSAILVSKHIDVPCFRFINAKGEWRWLESKVANLLNDPVVNSRDITEHKRAEEALILSEQKFKALVHNSNDLILMLDAAGRFTYISENAKNFIGYEQDELLGESAFQFIPQQDLPVVMTAFNTVLNASEGTGCATHRFLTREGNWLWLESRGVNHLANPVINGIIINAREITDRIRLQQKLDEELATRQLLITKAVITAQEKERSLVGLELHDNVNQVLTTVKLYQELCLTGIGDKDQLIRRSMDLLQTSINEIKCLSKRLSAPTLGNIKLHESVKELLDAVAATGKLQIAFQEVKMACREVEPELHLALYRILQEHLTNVLKHAKASRVEVKLSCKNRFLTLEVVDDGVGFDPGKKSDGIGITNMRTRAESVGGTFAIFSAPGKGTSLLVKFAVPS